MSRRLNLVEVTHEELLNKWGLLPGQVAMHWLSNPAYARCNSEGKVGNWDTAIIYDAFELVDRDNVVIYNLDGTLKEQD